MLQVIFAKVGRMTNFLALRTRFCLNCIISSSYLSSSARFCRVQPPEGGEAGQKTPYHEKSQDQTH